MKETALLIIDVQNDYFDGGKNPLVGPELAVQKVAQLLTRFREQNLPRIFIQHISRNPEASFFAPNTPGIEIHPAIKPTTNERIIQKQVPNSFIGTGLFDYLKSLNIGRLVICGMMTHMCVDATVRAAKDLGFDVLVIADACATKDLKFEKGVTKAEQVQIAFLSAFSAYYAKVVTTQEFLSGKS
ncbi:MAG: isochorismatase [Bacteroidetes bacterium GWA2_40_14]|jgi:nicotinamidase-related amidase|nr:MAG: isochorismatase [Bacteroidetes bacterium GWA2_40_14]HAZ00914.1 cysteine hydrolase [Marinilabiliales bacterium]